MNNSTASNAPLIRVKVAKSRPLRAYGTLQAYFSKKIRDNKKVQGEIKTEAVFRFYFVEYLMPCFFTVHLVLV